MARAVPPHRSDSLMLLDVTHDSASGAPTRLSNTMPTNLKYINPSLDHARFAPHSHGRPSSSAHREVFTPLHSCPHLPCMQPSQLLEGRHVSIPETSHRVLVLGGQARNRAHSKGAGEWALGQNLYSRLEAAAARSAAAAAAEAAAAVSTSRCHNPHPLASQPPIPASLSLFTPSPASLRLTPVPRRPCPHFYSCL